MHRGSGHEWWALRKVLAVTGGRISIIHGRPGILFGAFSSTIQYWRILESRLGE